MPQDKSSKFFITTGRVLLALYFLLPGIAKLLAPASQLSLMQHHGLAFASTLLMIAGGAQVLGALALLANRHVRKVCLGFVLYILLINGLMHDFWHFNGTEAAHEAQNFIKNLGILAGLLVLAGISPKRGFGLKGVWKSDGAMPRG
jgi:putative oxidoreductase